MRRPHGLQMATLGAFAAWAAWLLVTTGCASTPPETGRPQMREGRFATDDSVSIFYRVVGDGPQTVVIPADLYLYPAFEGLAEGRTLVFYDMRNRGRSDSVSADKANSILRDVADLEALRQHIAADSIDLIGFSFLGLMAPLYALEHAGHVRRIVQIGPVPLKFGTEYPKELTASDSYAALDAAGIEDLRAMRQQGFHYSDPEAYCEREWEVTRSILVGDPEKAGLIPSPCGMANEWPVNLARHLERHFTSVQQIETSWEQMAALTLPVLTIHGTVDRNAPYGAGREWAMMLPDARLVTVEGAAHFAWVEAPELVIGAIDTFLSGGWPEQAEKITSLQP